MYTDICIYLYIQFISLYVRYMYSFYVYSFLYVSLLNTYYLDVYSDSLLIYVDLYVILIDLNRFSILFVLTLMSTQVRRGAPKPRAAENS